MESVAVSYNPPIVDVPRGEDLTAENGPLLSCQTSWRNVKWNNQQELIYFFSLNSKIFLLNSNSMFRKHHIERDQVLNFIDV